LYRNGLVNHVIVGKMEEMIEVKRGREIRRKKLLDGFKEKEDAVNWKRKH
jgi:hypothetical protein